jgi:hypothetical protein
MCLSVSRGYNKLDDVARKTAYSIEVDVGDDVCSRSHISLAISIS